MSATTTCSRCRRDQAPALEAPPVPGEVGGEIQESICADCWAEWQKMEVMVINELRLNFMDPRAQKILQQHMLEFLCLRAPDPSSAGFPPPDAPIDEPHGSES